MVTEQASRCRLLVVGDAPECELPAASRLKTVPAPQATSRNYREIEQVVREWQPDLLLLTDASGGQKGLLESILDLPTRPQHLRLVLLDHNGAAFSQTPAVFAVLSPKAGREQLSWTLQLAANHARREREWSQVAATRQREIQRGILGESEAMRSCLRQLERLARVDATTLIQGESGTGKELLVRNLHQFSSRQRGPLVALNCAAIPEALLESELFGYERGAFTGAYESTAGRIERAEGGILFLDEVSDLPLGIQAKLLRFLQEREVQRLGGRAPIAVDIRVVCATHRDLQQEVAAGRFRADLLYRLDETRLDVPPLRQRHGDIMLLAREFLHRFAEEQGRLVRGFTRQAEMALEGHDWPGNVRELENRVRRALVMSEGAEIDSEALQLKAPDKSELQLDRVREQAEREAIIKALSRSDYNVTRAARMLGVARPTLHALMKRLGIEL